MGLPNDALNRIRDLTSADVEKATLGIGTTPFATTDTDLESPVSETISTPSIDSADQQFTTAYTLLSTVAVGTVFAEFGHSMNSAGTVLLSRQTFFPITHENTEEFNFNTTYFFKRNVQ